MSYFKLFLIVLASLVVFAILKPFAKELFSSLKDGLGTKILWWYRNLMRKRIKNGDKFIYDGNEYITVIDIGGRTCVCWILYKGVVYAGSLEDVFTWDKLSKAFVINREAIDYKIFSHRGLYNHDHSIPDWFDTIKIVKDKLVPGDIVWDKDGKLCIKIEAYDTDPNFFTFSFDGKKYRETIPKLIGVENGTFTAKFTLFGADLWREVE